MLSNARRSQAGRGPNEAGDARLRAARAQAAGRIGALAILVLGLAACASGGSAADQARNDHDLGPVSNFALATSSQVKTTGRNVDDIARRIGAATP